MTSLSLSLWIASGIILQLIIYLSVGFFRHWKKYQSLCSAKTEQVATEIQAIFPESERSTLPAWSGFRTFKIGRKFLENASTSICSFELVPEDGKPLPVFFPGQFLTFRLTIPSPEVETEQIVRCYSLSDAPRKDAYRISIKRAFPPSASNLPHGRSSFYFHDHVTTGSLLQVRAPAGHFHIDESDRPVVLIGSGIGITPMLSMLNWSLSQQKSREIWLFYGVRNSREMIMKQHFESLAAKHPNFHYWPCFSKPLPVDVAGTDYQHCGHIDVALLRMHLPLKPYHFYICGPSPMMESLVPALGAWGVPEERIHYEAFGPASIKHKQSAVAESLVDSSGSIVVNFAQSAKRLPWTSKTGSLLEFAEAHGISVNSGCRAGGCGCCQTRIQSGEVVYHQAPDFDPEPGTCLLCVCTPKNSVTLEA